MKKTLILELVASTILIAFSACSKGPNNGDPSSEIKPTAEVTISTTSQTLSSDGGNATIAFKATGSWAATTNVDWITIDQTSGNSGNVTINISVKKNEEYDQREGLVVISSGDVTKSITVTQKQMDALLLTSNSIILDDAGGNPTIEVRANIEYSCRVDDNAKSWISVLSTRALTTTNIMLNISENTTSSDRQGNVIIYSGNQTEVVTVYQKAKTNGSPSSLVGTSWYFFDTVVHSPTAGSQAIHDFFYTYTNVVIFSFFYDGQYVRSYGPLAKPEEVYYGTYVKDENDEGWYKLTDYDGTELKAEILDNVLYVYNVNEDFALIWRLLKL